MFIFIHVLVTTKKNIMDKKKIINDNYEQVVCSLCLASVWAKILWLVNVFSHN